MKKKIAILGSTGSIGKTTFDIIKKNKKDFEVILLTTNKNINTILRQSRILKVKNILISSEPHYLKLKKKLKNSNIKVHNNLDNLQNIIKKKIDYTMCAITGLSGLKPTLDSVKFSKTIAIANKESIICGWQFIYKALKKNKTKFIPIDSEHFSIWTLLKNQNIKNVKKIYITASGGPFLKKKLSEIKNIKPKFALRHPNWSMGKKISIDSATMMNKIFEVIEAIKIFNLKIVNFEILIHPKSFVHAIVHFKTGITKFLAHDTTMEIPIINSLYPKNEQFNFNNKNFNFNRLNGSNFTKPDLNTFPLLSILKKNYFNSYFETILITLNDELVKKYLNNQISYISIHQSLLKLIKNPYFVKYYKSSPNNINDIKTMVKITTDYLNKYLKLND